MTTIFRIATRRSPLALAQTEMVRAALLAREPGLRVEVLPMQTSGDIGQWGYKGLFTKELEDALLNREADLAVHSMKDMPSLLPEGLVIAGMLPREDARDAFVSPRYASLRDLPPGARIGSASVRRGAMLKRLRPDCAIIPLRGNVGTRLDKLAQGEADAAILAVAGLKRLGLAHHIREVLPVDIMLPAVAQGAIGIEVRMDDEATMTRVQAISHDATMRAVAAERALLAVLDGSCRTPLGGYATLEGEHLHLRAQWLSEDGSVCHHAARSGPAAEAETIGREVGEILKAHTT